LIAEEESTIIRSAQEKAAITAVGKGDTTESSYSDEKPKDIISKEEKGGEPLI
jgi:hypothetical protein